MAEIIIRHPGILSENSTRRIMREIRQYGPITKLELQQRLGLSHPTVQTGVNRLLEGGIIRAAQTQGAVRGRKPTAFTYCFDARLALGVELRTDAIRMVLTDMHPEVLARQELPGPGDDAVLQSPSFLSALNDSLNRFLIEQRVPLDKLLPVSLSLPGEISGSVWRCGGSSLSFDTVQHFFTLPLEITDTDGISGLVEIWSENTTDCTVLCLDRELSWYAARQGYPVSSGFLPMTPQTLPYPGSSRSLGHLTLYPGGRPCACGRRGCADAYCSMRVLLGDCASPEEFFAALQAGDAACAERFRVFLDALALLCCTVDMLYASEIRLTGVLSEFLAPYLPQLHAAIRENLGMGNVLSAPLSIGKYGRWMPAAAAALYTVAQFLDSDFFAEI